MKHNVDAPGVTRSFYWSVIALSVLIGGLWRLAVIGPPGFPLGEGGLFVLFSQELLSHGFALPPTVTYGGLTIPFAYPPLAFYLAAGVSAISGADLFSVYYWLPILLNLAAIPAFCFLAAQLTKDRVVLLCACVVYVQLPDSFMWQITGGGLPRALGALCALTAVALALRTARQASTILLLGIGACVGLAILSHLEWGIFAALGVTLAFATSARTWKNRALLTIGAGVVALLAISPWLAAVLSLHGLEPFRSSSSASNWNAGNFIASIWLGHVFGLLLWPAILGFFVTLGQRKWFLPLWLILTILLTPRMGAAAGLAIPGSILAGYGFKTVARFISDLIASWGERSRRRLAFVQRPWFGVETPVLGLILVFSLALLTPIRGFYLDPTIVQQVDQPSRSAMRWIRERTPPGSSFVVVSGAEHWFLDREAEWFPFLTERRSLTTAQGLEWGGPGVMAAKVQEITAFKVAQIGAPTVLPALLRTKYCGADYVAVFYPEGAVERRSLQGQESYVSVFSNESAQIFRASLDADTCARQASVSVFAPL